MEDWVNAIAPQVRLEDLPESYQEIARSVGVECALKLSECLGGRGFYFPQLDKILIPMRNKLIRREFNGANHWALARKYHLSERWIREIVEAKTIDNQLDLFEIPPATQTK